MASSTTGSRSYTRLMTSAQPPVVRIILSRPPVNVLDVPMMEELLSAIEEFDHRPDISTLIFAGSDRAFSAGVDVKAHTPDKVHEMLVKFHSVIRAVVATRKVTMAVVRGSCLGGGAELAAVCDLVFTADNATWGFPEITLAAFPPVAAVMLSAIIGQKRAADLILTGRSLTGEEAMRIGLANEAAPEAELADLVDEAAERLSQLSPSALQVAKKALYAWDAIHFDKGLQRAEQIYLEELVKLDDAREGVQAFLEKRKPVWTGK